MKKRFAHSTSRRLSRRVVLRGAGAGVVGLVGAALIGCGKEDGPATPQPTTERALLDRSRATAVAAREGGEADDEAASEGDAPAHQEAGSQDQPVAPADGHDEAAPASEHDEDAAGSSYLETASKDRLFLVRMGSFYFEPNVLEVGVGDVVEIAIQNVDPMLHDFTIDTIDADVHISYLEGTGQHAHMEEMEQAEKPDIHFALSEAGIGVVHIKVHAPGEYVFYCSVPGHRELGMEGTLIARSENRASTRP